MNRPASDRHQPITFQWALALTFVMWFAEVILTVVLRPMLIRHGLQPMAAASLIRVLACGGMFSVLLHLRGLSYRKLFHDSPASVSATLGLLGLPILMLVPLILMLDGVAIGLLEKVLPMSGSEADGLAAMLGSGIGTWVLVVGIAPLVEEMFFRGILLRGLAMRYPSADAMVYSAFVFGIVHLNVYQFVIAFAVGLLAAALYLRTRSLWPGIVLHAGLNLSVMVVATWGVDANENAPLWAWGLAAVCGLLGAIALRRMLWAPARLTGDDNEGTSKAAAEAGSDSATPPPDAA